MRKKLKQEKHSKYRILLVTFIAIYILLNIILIIHNINLNVDSNLRRITGLGSAGNVGVAIYPACLLQLEEEYNFVSLCKNTTSKLVGDVLLPIEGKYEFVLRWNPTTQAFETYSPEAATNEFYEMNFNESYFIYMKSNETLTLNGTNLGDVNIVEDDEYNAPGYPYAFSANISKYLGEITENISFALRWNMETQEFITYSPEAEQSDFSRIQMGEGQYIYFLVPGQTIRYNKTALQS